MKPVKILFFAPYPLRFFRLVKALQLIPNVSCRVCYSLAEAVQAVLQWNPTVAVVASAIDFCMTPTGEEKQISAWSREVLFYLRGVQSQGRDLPLAIFATPEPELGRIVVSVLKSFDVTFIVKQETELATALVEFAQTHQPAEA